MYIKLHATEKGIIAAACDEDLIGRIITEGNKVLDLKRYKEFYVGKKGTEKELEAALKGCFSANIVGKKSVCLALKMGLATENDVLYIKGFPYIHLYKV